MATAKKQADAKPEELKIDAGQDQVQAAGQASTDSNELIVTPEAILVRTRPGVERFCRGGHCFGADATKLKMADLTDDQLDAITGEAMLVVEYVIGDEAGGA
ncbi:MAG: hypothetical protein AB7S53_10510 [Thiomonas sp.]